MGYNISIPEGMIAALGDTEQDYQRIQMLRRKLKDLLGLRADTLRIEWLMLSNPEWDHAAKKKVILDYISDNKNVDLLALDSVQDLVPGGGVNSQTEANKLNKFFQYLQRNIRPDRPISLQYAQHTTTDGRKASGWLGNELDRWSTSQMILTHMDIKADEPITKVKCNYNRDERPAVWAMDHNPETGWVRNLGKPEVNDDDPFA